MPCDRGKPRPGRYRTSEADAACQSPPKSFQFRGSQNSTNANAPRVALDLIAQYQRGTSKSQMCVSIQLLPLLLQISIEPRQRSLQGIDAMLWLAQAMTFAGITHKHRLDSATT